MNTTIYLPLRAGKKVFLAALETTLRPPLKEVPVGAWSYDGTRSWLRGVPFVEGSDVHSLLGHGGWSWVRDSAAWTKFGCVRPPVPHTDFC